MHERARVARIMRERWSPLPTSAREVAEAEHLAFWIAEVTRSAESQIVGCVGLRRVGDVMSAAADSAEASCLASAEGWIHSTELAEVRRLRVDPEWRRRGIAAALMRELMIFAAKPEHGIRALVLSTTSAQLPALMLYDELGFSEVGRCYLDTYELLWLRRDM